MSVGFPADIRLHQFGRILHDAFGHTAYQVGSSLMNKNHRDVDVVVILPDDEFMAMFGTLDSPFGRNARWRAYCLAFSELGDRMTGLLIDFKLQPQTYANERHNKERNALILDLIIE